METILFNELIQKLSAGVSVEYGAIYCRESSFARSEAERRFTLFFKSDALHVDVLDVVFFKGMKPWYNPWIEITYPYPLKIRKNQMEFSFLNSDVEKKIIDLCCQHLPSAGKIFVSYDQDMETAKALMLNIPPPLTRLGFLLLESGCTWFKDWYFPEGGLEGGQKLQGEKPLDQKNKERQILKLRKQIMAYIDAKKEVSSLDAVEHQALERGDDVLKLLV